MWESEASGKARNGSGSVLSIKPEIIQIEINTPHPHVLLEVIKIFPNTITIIIATAAYPNRILFG